MNVATKRLPRLGLGVFTAVVIAAIPVRSDLIPDGKDLGHNYVGAGKCMVCHKKELMGNQFATWKRGPHYQAYSTLQSESSIAIAKERGLVVAPSEASECLICHVTLQSVPPERMAYPVELKNGVECESCHGPGKDYRKKTIMSDVKDARKNGLWDAGGDEGICLACHNSQSPTFDPKRYTLPDGSTAGFAFEEAKEKISHPIPADVRGKYLELEKIEKEKERAPAARAN